jgi:DNA-binding LacI/PurR family transcriptional regulator
VVVIAPQRAAAEELRVRPPRVPVVAVDGGLDADLPVVRVDQAAGARVLTEHLLALGHRTVHHVAGPPDWLEAEERVAGWQQALRAAGAPVPEPVYGDWSPRSGYAAGLVLAADARVTAVFAGNDQMALGVVRALQDSGRAVPGDVSVVGFDDIPEAEFFGPALTTIRQNFAEVGRRSITHLLALVSGGEPPGDGVVAAELVVRASTTTAPAPDPPSPDPPSPDPPSPDPAAPPDAPTTERTSAA